MNIVDGVSTDTIDVVYPMSQVRIAIHSFTDKENETQRDYFPLRSRQKWESNPGVPALYAKFRGDV